MSVSKPIQKQNGQREEPPVPQSHGQNEVINSPFTTIVMTVAVGVNANASSLLGLFLEKVKRVSPEMRLVS